MKKLILSALLALPMLVFAQDKPKVEKKSTEPTKKSKEKIAYILNNELVSKSKVDQLSTDQIKQINVVKEPYSKDGIEYIGQIHVVSVE